MFHSFLKLKQTLLVIGFFRVFNFGFSLVFLINEQIHRNILSIGQNSREKSPLSLTLCMGIDNLFSFWTNRRILRTNLAFIFFVPSKALSLFSLKVRYFFLLLYLCKSCSQNMKNIASGIIGLLFIFTCQAQNLYFKHLGIADGLSQIRIQTIYQDEIGAVWLGTSERLNLLQRYQCQHNAIPAEFQAFSTDGIDQICGNKKENSM